MDQCKNCKFWEQKEYNKYWGNCSILEDFLDVSSDYDPDSFDIHIGTPSEFYCSLFEQKEK